MGKPADAPKTDARTVLQGDAFGIGRALEPKSSLPQPAWKIDNSMELRPSEILIDVQLLNINLVSFIEILEEAEWQDDLVKKRIIDIVEARGKLHNPVTGTGGMLYGRVLEMGSAYPNNYNVSIGDEVISLTSLSLTPIRLDKILSIDYESAQLEVQARCILFANSPLVRRPKDLPLKLLVYALDEAGAPCRTDRTVAPGQSVLVMGANGKIGLLCAFAARNKLGATGRLVGLVRTEHSRLQVEGYGIFDEVIRVDATSVEQFQALDERHFGAYDLVINCVNSPSTELSSLLAVKQRGSLFFASLSSDYKLTALTAEGIGKEIEFIPYTGYMEGHSDFTLSLLRTYPVLRDVLLQKTGNGAQTAGRPVPVISQPIGTGFAGSEIFIHASEASRAALRRTLKVSPYNSHVLIYGESGVGKEIIARIIHQNSQRKSFPLIKINCASIPENLLESELFGYEKGSFTGASTSGKMGLWEAAQGGTLFLDEIGELPISFQAKLLRAIQEKEIIRIGGLDPIKADVRIIAASNRNLATLMRQGAFREDLYYRINVFPITIPPLRERREDIIPLIQYFTKKYNAEFGTDVVFTKQAKEYLTTHPFHGNVRELQNLIQRIIINAENKIADIREVMQALAYDREEELEPFVQAWQDAGPVVGDLSNTAGGAALAATQSSLKEILQDTEISVLREYKRKYGSTRKIAEALGTSQSSVVRKLRQYGLE